MVATCTEWRHHACLGDGAVADGYVPPLDQHRRRHLTQEKRCRIRLVEADPFDRDVVGPDVGTQIGGKSANRSRQRMKKGAAIGCDNLRCLASCCAQSHSTCQEPQVFGVGQAVLDLHHIACSGTSDRRLQTGSPGYGDRDRMAARAANQCHHK